MDDQGWQVNDKYCVLGSQRVIELDNTLDGIELGNASYRGSCRTNDEDCDRQPSNEAIPVE
jgi:hypothetical protein